MSFLKIEELEDYVLGFYSEPTKEKKIGDTLAVKMAEIEAGINSLFLKKMEDVQSDPNISTEDKVQIIISTTEELKKLLAELKTLKTKYSGLTPMVEELAKPAPTPQQPQAQVVPQQVAPQRQPVQSGNRRIR